MPPRVNDSYMAAGFIFGVLRGLLLIPAFGKASRHLIEFPLMFIAVAVIARPLMRRSFTRSSISHSLAVGMIGVIVLVVIESTFAMIVMGLPLATYLAGYDMTEGGAVSARTAVDGSCADCAEAAVRRAMALPIRTGKKPQAVISVI